jgi:GntR family transcriptional regulator
MAPRTAQRTKKSKLTRGKGFRTQRTARGVARYYLLYEHLSGALNDGTIPAGAALPSEPDLVGRYKLSRTTVRRALARLEEEGRIIRRRGSGTFARQNRKPAPLHLNLPDFFEDISGLAEKTTMSIVRFEVGPLPASLRELQARLGSGALIIQRIHRLHEGPYALTTAYIPEQLGLKIKKNALSRAPLIAVLDEIGAQASKSECTTSAVAADATAAKRLDVALGTPLLRTRAVLTDSRGQVHAAIESLFRPDRLNVRANLERNPSKSAQSPWRLKRD